MKIRIPSANRAVYPDVVAVRDKPEFWEGHTQVIVNPMLIVEVLSRSTQRYDRGEKFELYRTLPSFEEYVLVSQDKPLVEVWRLDDPETSRWSSFKVEGLNASVHLKSVGCDLAMADIYDLVEL